LSFLNRELSAGKPNGSFHRGADIPVKLNEVMFITPDLKT